MGAFDQFLPPAQAAAATGAFDQFLPQQIVHAPAPALVANRDPRFPQDAAVDTLAQTDPQLAGLMKANPGMIPLTQGADLAGASQLFHADDQETLDDSALGAAYRGAKSSILPAIGGLVTGAVGSVGGPWTGIPAAVGGAAAVAGAQNSFFPPNAHDIAQAQLDEQKHKPSRIAGEFAPGLVTLKPNLGTLGKALTGNAAAVGRVALGAGIGAGVPAAMTAATGGQQDPERLAAGALFGATMSPNKFGSYVLDKSARTEGAGNKVARNVVNGSVTDKASALANLDTADTLNADGVNLLSGDVSGDQGLMRVQRAATNRMDPTGKLATQDQANRAAIGNNIAKVTAEAGAPPKAAADYLTGELAAQRQSVTDISATTRKAAETDSASRMAAAQKAVTDAEAAAQTARDALAAEQGSITSSSNTSVKADAGAKVKDSLKAGQEQAKVKVNEDYAAAEARGVNADFTNTLEAAQSAAAEVGANGDVPARITRIIASRQSADPQPLSELRADLRAVNEDIRAANQAGQSNAARLLSKVKDGINADLEAIGEKVPELKVANEGYRGYAKQYLHDAAGDVLKKGRNGADSAVPPSKAIERALRSREDATQLAGNIKNDPEAKAAVRDWYVSDLAASNAKPTGQSVRAWLAKHSKTLDLFPEVAAEAKQMANRLESGSAKVAQLDTDIAAKQSGADVTKQTLKAERADLERKLADLNSRTNAEIKANPASAFEGVEPAAAIEKVMTSNKAHAGVTQLLRQASGDRSGAATEGLKNAAKAWLNKAVRNTGMVNKNGNATDAVETPELRVSLDKMNGLLLKGSDTRLAMEKLFTPDEMQKLDLGRKQIEVMARKIGAPSGGSDTEFGRGSGDMAEGAMNGVGFLGRILRVRTRGGVDSGPGFLAGSLGDLYDGVKSVWVGDFRGMANNVLVDALSDPRAMATLLRPVTKQSVKATSDLLRTYVPGRSAKDEEKPAVLSERLRNKAASYK